MDKKYRVLIVEDQHLLRMGLCRMVSELDDYCIAGEASGGIDACRLAAQTLPDLVLMDLSMPGGSGFEAITAIKRGAPHTRIIVLTVHRSEDHVRESFASGADGYVVKDSSFADLVREMRFVMQGKCVVGLDAYRARAGLRGLREESAHKARLWNALTSRERTVLRLVVEGHTSRQVGECLKLSPKTIEKHRANLMRKLGINNLTGLVHFAIDIGVLALSDNDRV
ncbi:response regulator transcription factor [Trinickia terrae]|uniref:Response regulator transcription factor n=1 Tax=Trinickia terrae TaxID=2571161 RepID=A0A4U1I7T1_9BURK|nr:response regulator transcription factor [Trinickia terrae]TKC89486.1 response regulator transcription factor [Trinickia terrae]